MLAIKIKYSEKPSFLPQVTSQTRPCHQRGSCRGSRGSSATPTTPVSSSRPEESLLVWSPTTTTPCKPPYLQPEAVNCGPTLGWTRSWPFLDLCPQSGSVLLGCWWAPPEWPGRSSAGPPLEGTELHERLHGDAAHSSWKGLRSALRAFISIPLEVTIQNRHSFYFGELLETTIHRVVKTTEHFVKS